MANIAEILQNFPKGTKLYSPLLGEVYLKFVSPDELIYVIAANGSTYDFNAVGKYYGDIGECLLFPSEDHREWDEDGIELLNKKPSVFMSKEEAEAHSIKVSSQPYDYPGVFDKILEKLCEIQGKMGDIYAVVSKQPTYAIFPELAESEDERIKKELIAYHRSMAAAMNGNRPCVHEAWIAWLEKQGEQKPVNDTDEDIVEAVKDTSILDLVEPKFHEGEWVVQKGLGKYKIVEVCESWYEVISYNDGIQYSIGFDKENDCHLWTIQDAKDGDVLVEDSCIFIIQKLGDNSTAAKTYCTLYNDGDFDDGSILYFDIDSTKPATKEQRDTLMKAMADAGWEFDFEKKELKKIEQKLAWSEEDEKILNTTISFLSEYAAKGYENAVMCMDWLKSLKERIGG